MAVPDWVSYVGLVGGVVGTVSGCLAYRRTGQLKVLDLRLDLRKIDADNRSLVESLPNQLDLAKRSHERVLAALGSVNSGAMVHWKTEWDKDVDATHALKGELPAKDAHYRGVAADELETLLVAGHTLQAKAKAIADKYAASLANDDRDREFIRSKLPVARPPGG